MVKKVNDTDTAQANIDLKRRGLLIAVEGIDGTGKTTQLKLLGQELSSQGLPVLVTREPTDGQFGRQIRELFVNRKKVRPEEELELFLADRHEHVTQVIAPALAGGKIVLTDRYYFSTAAYQGALGHDPEEIIVRNEAFAPIPDLVIILTLPPILGVQRIEESRKEIPNDFEGEDNLTRVAAIFERLERPYIKRVDGRQTVAQVHRNVMMCVEPLLHHFSFI